MLGHHEKSFTLIELLFAIAIIAILAAILFPVFARARENAHRASCQSNEKQIGLAFMQYTQDYDEILPVSYGYGGSGGNRAWDVNISPYLMKAGSQYAGYALSKEQNLPLPVSSQSGRDHRALLLRRGQQPSDVREERWSLAAADPFVLACDGLKEKWGGVFPQTQLFDELDVMLASQSEDETLVSRQRPFLPHALRAFQVTYTDMKGQHLQVTTREDNPHPCLLCFGADKTPCTRRGPASKTTSSWPLWGRSFSTFFKRAYTVLGLTLKVRQIARRGVFSAKELRIICAFSEAGQGKHTGKNC